MSYKVYVDGQEGTTGLRIHEYLARRGDVEVLRIRPGQAQGPGRARAAAERRDVAFLCLPDAASREAAAMVTNPRTCLIDASTAHRTAPGWTFGLPELARGQAREDSPRRSASPIPVVTPARSSWRCGRSSMPACWTRRADHRHLDHRLLGRWQEHDRPVRAGAIRSSSRRGPMGSPRPQAPARDGVTHSGLKNAPVFTPIVADFYKGLAVTVPLHLATLRTGTTPARVRDALAAHYDGERFIRVMPLRDPETLAAASSTCRAATTPTASTSSSSAARRRCW